jgi:hypothetical protein
MNRPIFIPALLALLLAIPSIAEEIYKWEDESGQMHYSDVPQDGAAEVEIAPIQTFSAPTVAADTDSDSEDQEEELNEEDRYDSLAISSPSMEETIWNTGGNVTVNVSLQPSLRAGHRITLHMDGMTMGDLPRGAAMLALKGVERGEHKLWAEVTTKKGRSLIQSDQTTFYYQQTAVQSPARRRR